MMTLAHGLKSRGHRVHFIAFEGRGLTDYLRGHGFTADEVKVRAKVDPIAVMDLARMFKDARADVVQAHLATACLLSGLAGRVARIPTCTTVHGMSGKLNYITGHRLVAVSHGVKEHLVRQGVKAGRISVVHNGIPIGRAVVNRNDACSRLGLDPNKRYVVSTARLADIKGVHIAIEAMAQLPPELNHYHYLIAGDGPERERYVDLAKAVGVSDRVHMIGYIPNPYEALAAADLFVLPSLQEALSVSLMEAMECHLPLVASRVGGVPEVVDEACGSMVEPGNPNALAEAMAAILKNPEQRESMGRASFQRLMSHFTQTHMTLGAEAVYLDMIAAKATRPQPVK